MASLGSSIRSAARDTSSAYKRLPIRWRLAGGSAALTLVILCGFAAIVGVLTTRQIQQEFSRRVSDSANELARDVKLRVVVRSDGSRYARKFSGPSLTDYARSQDAAVRIITPSGDYVTGSEGAPNFGPYIGASANIDGWRVESRDVEVLGYIDPIVIQYAQRLSSVQATANRVKVFLAFGVLGGGLLALLAGLATARRAMEPIAEMTAVARGDRGDAHAPARVRRGRLARAAHAADLGAGQPRAARGVPRRRAARGGRLRPALVAPDAPARGRPAAARARGRRPRDRPRAHR